MDREPPPVTVTAPDSGGPPPDVLDSGPTTARRPRVAVVLGLLGVLLLGATAVRDGGSDRRPAPAPPPPPVRTVTSGITASAALAGAPTDEPGVQRLVLTVGIPPFDGRSDSGGRLLGDEVVLLGVDVRGFTVEPARQLPVPLGRFGRATDQRSTTVPLTAVVDDCSVDTLARRDLVLSVRTGEGPAGTVRAVTDADVVRALDRLMSRTCRRPRG